MFDIKFNYENGGVDSMANTDDKDAMNWVEGVSTWGTIKDSEVVSVEKVENGVNAVYKTKHLLVHAERRLENNIYTRKNTLSKAQSAWMYFSTAAQSEFIQPLTTATQKRAYA